MTTATVPPRPANAPPAPPGRRHGDAPVVPAAAILAATILCLAGCGVGGGDGDARRSPGRAAGSLDGGLAEGAAGSYATEIASPAAPGSGQPFLAPAAGGVWMSWTEPSSAGHRVALSRFDGDGWSPPATVAEGDAFFVNWADFPSVQPFRDGLLVAHWLQRGGQSTYDYGVRISWSADGGATWSRPWTPHEDGTPTEHGFVSLFERGGAVWAAWLDGRAMTAPGGPMSVRARSLPLEAAAANGAGARDGVRQGAGPAPGPEMLVDGRACECCQTDAVVAAGVPVLAYRDRVDGEIRDIAVSRLLDTGWTPGEPVHEDGWVIGGCPVNGPALAARDAGIAVAWFTAPENRPRVNVAFSADGAVAFGAPVRVDAGQPAGRVDVVMLDDGSALVTWLERGAGGARILSRRVEPGGRMGDPVPLADTDAGRASGFPRIARLGPDRLMLAWTDPAGDGRVRVAVLPLELWLPL